MDDLTRLQRHKKISDDRMKVAMPILIVATVLTVGTILTIVGLLISANKGPGE